MERISAFFLRATATAPIFTFAPLQHAPPFLVRARGANAQHKDSYPEAEHSRKFRQHSCFYIFFLTDQREFYQNICRWVLKDKIKILKSFCSNLTEIRALLLVLNMDVCVTKWARKLVTKKWDLTCREFYIVVNKYSSLEPMISVKTLMFNIEKKGLNSWGFDWNLGRYL